jgi:hypothetical protein
MRRFLRSFAVILCFALVGVSSASASTVTYALVPLVFSGDPNFGTDIVTGTITTDGTFSTAANPYLTSSDIVGWSLTLTLGSTSPVNLSNTSPGANFALLSSALIATPLGLFYNFNVLNAEIAFWQSNVPPYPNFNELYFQGPTSNAGPSEIALHYCLPICYGPDSLSASGVDLLAFATPAVSATPLPAALPLFAGGLGALGLLGWCRKRKTAALAA